MRTWYLSFAENGWKGFCVVEARDGLAAVARAHELGINPGGDVMTVPLSERFASRVGAEWRDRLFDKVDDCRRFDAAVVGGDGRAVRGTIDELAAGKGRKVEAN